MPIEKAFVVVIIPLLVGCCDSLQINAPKLLSWDGAALYALRTQLIRRPYARSLSQETSAALHHLLVEVAKIHTSVAAHGVQTVTSKTWKLPGNSTRNHFVSIVPYAFPCNQLPVHCVDYHLRPVNRSNCDSATGLPWHICDGELNQVARDSMTDRRRLDVMMGHVMRLSLSAYVFRDHASAAAAARILRAWFVDARTRMLPSLKYAQGVPGVMDGRASGCIDLSFVGRGFADAVRLLKYTPEARAHWKVRDQRRMMAWCSQMAQHMMVDSSVSRESKMRNNHGLFYDNTVLSLVLLSEAVELPRNVSTMLSARCRGWKWCVRGRLQDQIDEDGVQIHEMHRPSYGHYMLYALLAHSHLFVVSTRAGMQMDVRESALVKATDWTLRNFENISKGTVQPWLTYGAQAYRMVSRLTLDVKYETAACEVLRMMKNGAGGERWVWSMERVGMDVWNVVYPALPDAEECVAWRQLPRLSETDVKALERRRPRRKSALPFLLVVAVGATVGALAFRRWLSARARKMV